MIARIWRGAVAKADGDEYEQYIDDTGFSAYGKTPVSAHVFLRMRWSAGTANAHP